MDHVTLSSGNQIPVIGLGTWQLSGAMCTEAVTHALRIGYTHIDTAAIYHNHVEVGAGIRRSGARRDSIFLTSKVWREHLRYNDLIRECEKALTELRTDYLDLYLIHWPNKAIPIEESLTAMVKLRSDGKIRDMGVSNFTAAHVREAVSVSGAPIVNNQVEYHAHFNQEELLSACRSLGVVVTAYSPLGRGDVLADPVLTKIAAVHGRSTAQIALRWLTQKGIVVIPKASSREHLSANLDILSFRLSDAEVEEINRIKVHRRLINPGFAEFDRV